MPLAAAPRCLLAAALAVLLLGLAGAPAAGAAGPARFWGVVPQHTLTQAELLRLKRGGVDSVRVPVSWARVMGTPNTFDWSGLDGAVERTARARIETLPFVYASPKWVARPENTIPVRNGKQRRAWMGFLKALARRYGPQGSFWAENPGVPRRPVRTWQIWNEPNYFYFSKRPNPGRYGQLVKISHRALSSVDPGARLVLGGMFSLPRERPPSAYAAYRFLLMMYRRHPGIERFFEGIAIHPYTRHYKYLTPILNQVRWAVRRAGDPGVGLWLTEMGWGSQGGPDATGFEKGRKGQVRQLKGSFKALLRHRRAWRLKRVYWFSVTDFTGEEACNFCDSSGLFTENFGAKPAWHAFTRFGGGRPR